MTGSATIIAFHAIEHGAGPICMAPNVFRDVVGALVDHGCSFLRVDEIVAGLRGRTHLPSGTVGITFDDGYESVHRTALPLLASLNLRATVFPVTSQLGAHNAWDADRGGPRLSVMGAAQLGELVDAGWEIGAHTHTHASLPSIPSAQIIDELSISNAVLEDLSGRRVTTFAYPYGHHDTRTCALAATRYDACVTIGSARARAGDPLDRLPRVESWYLRRDWQVRALVGPSAGTYLAVRRALRAVGATLRG